MTGSAGTPDTCFCYVPRTMNEIDALASVRWVWELFAFLFGISVGSFLNVVIARVPEGLSVVKPRSRCPKCGHEIAWYDNLPLLSWLLLRGKCRGCKTSISIRYPTVELLVGLLALALARRYGFDWPTLSFFIFCTLLVAITYIDLDHWIIPHVLTWPGILIGIISSFGNPALGLRDASIGALVGFFAFAGFAFFAGKIFNKDALGAGDWWLMAMIGAFLGWQSLLPVVLLASIQGSVIGILLIVLGRSEKGEEEAYEEEEDEGEQPSALSRFRLWLWPIEFMRFLKRETVGEGTEEEQIAEDEAWVPPRHAVPFGPFLSLAALEELFVGDWLRGYYDQIIAHLIAM